MNNELRAEARLLADAARRHGCFTWAQAVAAGCPPALVSRRVATRVWERVLPGVYCVAGAPVTVHQQAAAATLWGGADAALSHESAARLLRLDDAPPAGTLHVLVPRTARGLRRQRILTPEDPDRAFVPVVAHTTIVPLEAVDRLMVDDVACVSAAVALIQCARSFGDERIDTMFESARRMGLVSNDHLQRRADAWSGSGHAGCRRIRRILASQLPGGASEYKLEVKAKRLIASSALPRPTRQHWVKVVADWFRLDLAWVDQRVAVECEGWEFHGNRRRWKRDRRRLALLEAAGWRVIVVSWDDVVHHPQRTLDRIALALAERDAAVA